MLKHIPMRCKTESPVYSLKTENTTSFEEFVYYLQKAIIKTKKPDEKLTMFQDKKVI